MMSNSKFVVICLCLCLVTGFAIYSAFRGPGAEREGARESVQAEKEPSLAAVDLPVLEQTAPLPDPSALVDPFKAAPAPATVKVPAVKGHVDPTMLRAEISEARSLEKAESRW